ncbi:PhoH family protein [Candidatus Azambacteria bacterium]|nr:PhoH family protein [Candidatus Azambacteria bacterium]
MLDKVTTHQKVYVLDTSVLIHNANAIFDFQDNTIIIPVGVLEELDGLRKSAGEKGFVAREISRTLEEMTKGKNVTNGIKTKNGGMLLFELNGGGKELLPENFGHSVDNSIIAVTLKKQSEYRDRKVILVSKDINLRLKAQALGVEAEDYKSDKVTNISKLYTGFTKLHVSAGMINSLFQDGSINAFNFSKDLNPNTCLKLICESSTRTALAVYNSALNKFFLVKNPRDPKDTSAGIAPKNDEQALAYYLAMDQAITLLTLSGPPGTGKTLMALLAAYHQLEKKQYDKIIVFRPLDEVEKDMGYLPGSLKEKFNPRTTPIVSNMALILGNERHKKSDSPYVKQGNSFIFDDKNGDFSPVEEVIERGLIEIIPINFIRGCTLHNSIIIIDEAQNFSNHGLKTAITRAGEGSKIILTGDLGQIDNPYLDAQSSGFTKVISSFTGQEIFGHLVLRKGERSKLAEIASRLL